eukprot:s1115_g18.t1
MSKEASAEEKRRRAHRDFAAARPLVAVRYNVLVCRAGELPWPPTQVGWNCWPSSSKSCCRFARRHNEMSSAGQPHKLVPGDATAPDDALTAAASDPRSGAPLWAAGSEPSHEGQTATTDQRPSTQEAKACARRPQHG